MKYLYYLLFFISFNSFAQTSFYSATLTDNDDTKKQLFKNKQRVLNDDGTLIVYNSESSDSKVYLKAGDFKSIKTADKQLHLISVSVPNLAKTNNIILRELVAGVSSLYAYKDREGKLIYVDLTNNEFTVLARTRKDAGAPVAYRQCFLKTSIQRVKKNEIILTSLIRPLALLNIILKIILTLES